MGQVQLNISTNIQELIDRVNKLEKSVEDLNKSTAEYQQKSKQAYDTATREAEQFNQAQVKNQQTMSKSMQMAAKFGGILAGVFSVGAILKWGKAILESTGKGADAMEEFSMGVKSMGEALNRAIAAGDFGSIITGLQNAYKEGKLFAQVLDEIKQRQAALGVFRETIDTQIAEQRVIAMNAQLSIEVRRAAIEEIIRLEKQKRDETLALADTELAAYLRNSAVQIDAANADEESIQRRQELILELAKAYETAAGTDILNQQLEEARKLDAYLKSLITTTQAQSGFTIRNTAKYEEALKNLTPEQEKLLELLKVQNTLGDEELIKINQLRATRQSAFTEQLEGEAAVSRRRNALLTEFLAGEKKKQESLDETLKKEIEYYDKLWELYGGPPSFEDWQKPFLEQEKFIKDNIAAFQDWADDNPMYSGENAFEAQEFDKALEDAKKKILELEQFANDHPFWEALGFENEEQIQAAKDYASEIFDLITSVVDAQVEASERLVDDLNQRIDEQEQLVNREFELKKEGLGNNYALEQENLVKMQQARDQAIKDREKNIRIQRTLSTIEASISLITATANIMKGFSSIPVVGVVLGILAVGAMIAAFVAAQSKVKDVTQFAKGGKLKGLRHSEGGIPIPGTGIEVEGDEYVTNRRSTQKYLPLLEAINKDDAGAMKLFFDRKFINKVPQAFNSSFDIDKSQKLGQIVTELRRGKGEIIYGDGFIIEKSKGYTKRINLN